jgi:microtubule-associated protein-like 6
VNSTCRSHSRAVLASADDLGKVKLFKYPCVVEKGAQFKEYMGHSSHVTKCKFSANDNFLVTTGGNDKTVLIWETDFGVGAIKALPAGPASAAVANEEKKQGFEMLDDEMESFSPKRADISKSIKLESKAIARAQRSPTKTNIEVEENSMFEVVDVGHGDEFSATLPWLG